MHGFKSWMIIKCCLNVAMGGIGILVTKYWLRFNTCTLLKWFLPIIVLLFGWQTFWLIAHARIGRTVLGTPGDYLEFVQTHLQGFWADISGASMTFFLFQIILHHDLHHQLSFSLLCPLWKCLIVAFLGFIFWKWESSSQKC